MHTEVVTRAETLPPGLLAPPAVVTATSLRRQKSTNKVSKSGAYHAHEFNKSIGRDGSSRARLYDMWQEEESASKGTHESSNQRSARDRGCSTQNTQNSNVSDLQAGS